jgi:hypothetical protein
VLRRAFLNWHLVTVNIGKSTIKSHSQLFPASRRTITSIPLSTLLYTHHYLCSIASQHNIVHNNTNLNQRSKIINMLSPEHITDADMDVAVHADPSTDPDAWQQGAETLDEYFGPGGSFWSEPVNHDGEYVSEGSKDMSISSGSSPEIGSGSGSGKGKGKGNGSGNEIGMGTGKVNANVGMSSSGIGGAMNGLNIDYSSDQQPAETTIIDETYIPHRHNAPHSGFDQQQHPIPGENTTYNSSPPTTQPTKHGPRKRPSPTVEIKQPKKSDKMHAELSDPVTPQLGTPFVRGRTTRSTKGAEDMRLEMEVKEKELAEIQVKTAAGSLKRKMAAETPVQPRKQPKRAAKDKKK